MKPIDDTKADAVLHFVHRYHAAHGYMPVYAEIARGTGVSVSWAWYLVTRVLREEGLIYTYSYGRGCRRAPRSFRLSTWGKQVCEVNS